MKKWIVGEGDGRTVGEIVLRAGEALSAIEEGRVFVGRVRAERAEMNVQAGDEVTIAAPVRAEASIDVLYLSSEIVAANKPAGIPTIADLNGGAHALHDRLAKQLNVPKGDLHPTSRLDHDVSGVVVFARTKRAAGFVVSTSTVSVPPIVTPGMFAVTVASSLKRDRMSSSVTMLGNITFSARRRWVLMSMTS